MRGPGEQVLAVSGLDVCASTAYLSGFWKVNCIFLQEIYVVSAQVYSQPMFAYNMPKFILCCSLGTSNRLQAGSLWTKTSEYMCFMWPPQVFEN